MHEDREQLREELAAFALGALGALDRERVAAHLRDCADCASLLAEYEEAVELLAFAVPVQQPPFEARAALMTRVRAISAPGAIAVSAHQPVPPAEITQRVPRSLARWRRPFAWAAAAAALFGLLFWNVQLQRARDNRAGSIAQLAGGPDRRATMMVSTAAAPGATGRFYFSQDGSDGVLAVSGLPALQPGRVYQFWFATSDSALRDSAGVFRVNAKGDALVTIQAPGPLRQYQQIWITQEAEGGSTVPTAPHFLEGPL